METFSQGLARIAHAEGTNFSVERGYPYGVFDPREHIWLYDDIITSGTNMAYASFCDEIQQTLVEAETVDDLVAMLSDYSIPATILSDAFWAGDHELIMDYLNDHGYTDFDEPGYYHEYRCGETGEMIKLQVGYLGGAPLCWVLDSPWVCRAPYCSPCVPGAGNLDGGPHTDGDFVLCLPPADMNEVWGTVRRITEVRNG